MICPNCRNDVNGVWTDVGLGSYEYWGFNCTQSRMALVCESCDSELESEHSYEDHVADMMEDSGRYREDD